MVNNPPKLSHMENNDIKALHKKVFCYDRSAADERFFRQRIVDYLQGKGEETLTKTMWHAIWERNGGGKTLYYCYFNERIQKVYIDRHFMQWASLMCEILSEQVKLINEHGK